MQAGESVDFIDANLFNAQLAQFTTDKQVRTDYFSAFVASQETFKTEATSGKSGVCATVKIQISQELVLTRAAFTAKLEVSNGGDVPLTNLRVVLEIKDSLGDVADVHFAMGNAELVGITGVTGNGTLAAKTSGDASWLIIPRRTAAPIVDTIYTVGGVFEYTTDGKHHRKKIRVILSVNDCVAVVFFFPGNFRQSLHQHSVSGPNYRVTRSTAQHYVFLAAPR